MVSTIRHQIFDGRTCPWAKLHFVKHDQRLARNELDIEIGAQIREQRIKVIQLILKKLLYFFFSFVKINQNVTIIFTLRELFRNVALADTPCPVNQQRCTVCVFFLPFQKLFIDFSFHGCPAGSKSRFQDFST